MAGGLVALLDDVAALARLAAASIDDVAAGTMKASAKAAGVVIDDAAVTPQYLDGVEPNRELPIIKKISTGSIRNKLIFILPVILLLSEFLPQVLTPLLMLGGTYLCFEGAEKVYEKVRGKHAEKDAPAVEQGAGAEDQIVKSAVTTDFILSAEIMVISLDQVVDESFWIRALILVVVAVLITAVVYGAVAILVKMDDIGLSMTKKSSEFSQKVGKSLVTAMPKVMDFISVVGTFAMLWVGGHLILVGVHEFGFTPIHDFVGFLQGGVEDIATVGGLLAWLADTVVSLIFGLVWGLIVVFIVHVVLKALGKGHGKALGADSKNGPNKATVQTPAATTASGTSALVTENNAATATQGARTGDATSTDTGTGPDHSNTGTNAGDDPANPGASSSNQE